MYCQQPIGMFDAILLLKAKHFAVREKPDYITGVVKQKHRNKKRMRSTERPQPACVALKAQISDS